MGEVFGAKFVNQYGGVDDSAFRTWLQVLHDLTPAQIKQGFVNLCIARPKFIPDALEFREYCKGNSFPDPYEAYVEACNAPSPKKGHAWTHPVVYWTGENCGWSFLASTMTTIAFPRWKGIYAQVCKRAEAGEDLDVPVLEMLELKPQEPATKNSPGYQRFRELMADIKL